MAQYAQNQYKMYKNYLYVQLHVQYTHVLKHSLHLEDAVASIK